MHQSTVPLGSPLEHNRSAFNTATVSPICCVVTFKHVPLGFRSTLLIRFVPAGFPPNGLILPQTQLKPKGLGGCVDRLRRECIELLCGSQPLASCRTPLSLLEHVHHFNPSQCLVRGMNILEFQHRSTRPLDTTVNLFDNVVEILALTSLDVLAEDVFELTDSGCIRTIGITHRAPH